MNRVKKHAELQELRALLKREFPEAHQERLPESEEPVFRTGIPAVDQMGLPQTGLLELVGGESSGLGLLLWGVARYLLVQGHPLAWIDRRDACDVTASWSESCLARLLWVRCRHQEEAVRAMDLLVRDGNVRHLILDLRQPAGERSHLIPHPVWYRLRNVAEESGLWILVASRQRLVPCAVCRGELTSRYQLKDLHVEREALLERLVIHASERRTLPTPETDLAWRQVG